MRIFHPRPQIGRQHFIGVDFQGGVAEVEALHPERRLALEQHGFRIEEAAPEVVAAPLAELTVAELREIADFEGVEVPKGAKKADIIAALDEQREALAATPAEIAILDELAAELRASVDADEV